MFFNIERSSTDTGATIKFSNVFVKIDRSVPETSTPYELIVWGSAIANNYNNTSDAELDNFATPGVKVPYVSVVTAASDKPGLFTQAVSLTIGERVYTVNDNTFEMDAEPYISLESNSTMVPIRFIANAFGFKDEQIIWDDASRTVSIIESTGKIVQFTAGSDKMVINGASITIQSPDHLPVKSEIKNDRMYISFRALGDVFAVPVYWDSSTQTAYYNYNANDKVVIEDSEISEAERLSSDDTDNSEIYESIEGDTQYEYEVA
jgi:hypothetical protein